MHGPVGASALLVFAPPSPTPVRRWWSEGEAEDRSLSGDAVGPHSSTVATHDSFDGGQPESAPRVLSLRMESLEGFEDDLTVGLGEADPIVSDVVDGPISLVLDDTQLDSSVIDGSGVLPRILEQVGQENLQERLVTKGRDSRLRLERHLAIRDQGTQILDDLSPQQ